jgi:formylglycine-generating enzyme
VSTRKSPAPSVTEHARDGASSPHAGMVWLPGGTFLMGSDDHYPEEAPAHPVTVDGFWMDATAVTNSAFRRFVEATGHITLAEQPPNAADYPSADPALLVPGSGVFQKPSYRVDLRAYRQWWSYLPGADWRHPEGPGSSLNGRWSHPVVHVAYPDAEAYAAWAGKALPTEAEWEFAARGGLAQKAFPWGDEPATSRPEYASRWLTGPEPVGTSAANGYGLFDMCENVHEWCSDWFQRDYYAVSTEHNPQGPASGERRASRGGSWRHHIKVSRCAARSSIPPQFQYADYGFRVVCEVG